MSVRCLSAFQFLNSAGTRSTTRLRLGRQRTLQCNHGLHGKHVPSPKQFTYSEFRLQAACCEEQNVLPFVRLRVAILKIRFIRGEDGRSNCRGASNFYFVTSYFSASSSACFSCVDVLAGLNPTKRCMRKASREMTRVCGID
jgi:hypothetical protein